MPKKDKNKIIDEWMAEQNNRAGEEYVLPVGLYPPDRKAGVVCGINNELITADLIRHYADAIGDKNPLWRSEAYAEDTIWQGIIAPPTITDCVAPSFTVDRDRLPAGITSYTFPAGTQRQWYRAIRPGDKFKVIDKFLGIEEIKGKQERPFRMFLYFTQRSYIDQKEETVAFVIARMIIPIDYVPAAGEESLFVDKSREIGKYTDEQRDDIYRAYEEEDKWNTLPVYWEDVEIGGEIKPVVAGPLSIWDTVAFLTCLGFTSAFSVSWEVIKADFSLAYLDPKVNAWKQGGELHLCDGLGLSPILTGGYAFGYGNQIEGLLCRMIYNWTGDSGFLKSSDYKYRRVSLHGDVMTMKGKVNNKFMKDGEHLVELQVHCENQSGLILMSGSAIVRLPVKKQ